jgi:hypothetical protein
LVELEPPTCFLDANGRESFPSSDDWRIAAVETEYIKIENTRTQHQTLLAKDHIHNYTSNPAKSPDHGFLTLSVRLFIKGTAVTIRPCPRPGESIAPLPLPEIVDKWVGLFYPLNGLAQSLGIDQNMLGWVHETRVATLIANGTSALALESDGNGRFYRLCVKAGPNLVLVRRLK